MANSSDSEDDLRKFVKKYLMEPQHIPTPPKTITTTKRVKHQSPQENINEFWTKFNTKTPGKASTILPIDSYAKKVSDAVPKATVRGQPESSSYEEAVRTCKLKVEKIVKECRRVNQKYRDTHFDIEFDLKWGRRDCLETLAMPNRKKTIFRPQSVKRVGDIFEKPSFYVNGPAAKDIRQGQDGDCWLMAALCTLGNKKGLIEKVCVARNEMVGVYGFVFYRDSEWRSEIIDDKLYLNRADYDESIIERVLWEDRERISSEEEYKKAYQTNSGALYFAQCEDPNETWLPLLEKAYAKAHGDYAAIEGGYTGEGIEDLTGGVTTELFSTDILDKEDFWKKELLKVNDEFLFGCATGLFRGWGDRKGIKERHAYSIMRAVEIDGQRLLLIKNPWGKGEWTGPWSDGSKEWTPEWMTKLQHRFGDDGTFWMSYEDFFRKYQTFHRTRLFTDEWKVTQQWATLKVPWTVDYHDTKFAFTISKPASVVVVLTQLDTRYFKGLEGQYFFDLAFRLHKAGEEDYIVRSHGNYCMRRSVSAELDLDEAGEYSVLIKVTAQRDLTALPVETVIRDNAKERRDKLVRIGLAYDLAHAKGQVEETEEEKKSREKAEARAKAKERKEYKDKLTEEKKKTKRSMAKKAKKEKALRVKMQARQESKEKKEAEKKKADEEAAGTTKPSLEPLKADIEKTEDAKTDDDKHKVSSEALASPDRLGDLSVPGSFPWPSIGKTLESNVAAAASSSSRSRRRSTNRGPSPPPVGFSSAYYESRVSFSQRDAAPFNDAEESDTDSCVSSVSSSTIDAEIAKANAPPPPKPKETEKKASGDESESEDEFEKDPWNAAVVVGLRVYAKEKKIIKIGGEKDRREKVEEEEVDDKEKKEGEEDKKEIMEGDEQEEEKTENSEEKKEKAKDEVKEKRKEEGEKDKKSDKVDEEKNEETKDKNGSKTINEKKEGDDGKAFEVSIRVVRPRTWEDGETSLDVDDSAMDATKNLDEAGYKKLEDKESVVGIHGRLGSVTA